ncbi:MAG: ATP-binding cassette domain-containing protein, partial [Solirubrobacterales bacterium]|nr:ATP-binding cassette domain-containing protein [Solirubrobacterales bacterium]
MRIDVAAVSKRFGAFTALEDITLEVPEGSLTALLGPSGSGKSTLLRIVAGLETPDAGTVCIDGADVTRARPQERGIGFVFQHYAAFAHMSVFENVAFGLRIRKRPRAEVRERVDELLALVGLTTWAAQRPDQLSGG